MTDASDRVAASAVKRLLADGLILPADADRMSANMAAGKLKAGDWTLLLQKPLDKKDPR